MNHQANTFKRNIWSRERNNDFQSCQSTILNYQNDCVTSGKLVPGARCENLLLNGRGVAVITHPNWVAVGGLLSHAKALLCILLSSECLVSSKATSWDTLAFRSIGKVVWCRFGSLSWRFSCWRTSEFSAIVMIAWVQTYTISFISRRLRCCIPPVFITECNES